ncbi:hypothetical protein NEOKW01_1316 [Nematocida sp. AWRm80]|nr:hypothetical protein NEOKW01_1316 [Nematocida sp. AWRm80]
MNRCILPNVNNLQEIKQAIVRARAEKSMNKHNHQPLKEFISKYMCKVDSIYNIMLTIIDNRDIQKQIKKHWGAISDITDSRFLIELSLLWSGIRGESVDTLIEKAAIDIQNHIYSVAYTYITLYEDSISSSLENNLYPTDCLAVFDYMLSYKTATSRHYADTLITRINNALSKAGEPEFNPLLYFDYMSIEEVYTHINASQHYNLLDYIEELLERFTSYLYSDYKQPAESISDASIENKSDIVLENANTTKPCTITMEQHALDTRILYSIINNMKTISIIEYTHFKMPNRYTVKDLSKSKENTFDKLPIDYIEQHPEKAASWRADLYRHVQKAIEPLIDLDNDSNNMILKQQAQNIHELIKKPWSITEDVSIDLIEKRLIQISTNLSKFNQVLSNLCTEQEKSSRNRSQLSEPQNSMPEERESEAAYTSDNRREHGIRKYAWINNMTMMIAAISVLIILLAISATVVILKKNHIIT